MEWRQTDREVHGYLTSLALGIAPISMVTSFLNSQPFSFVGLVVHFDANREVALRNCVIELETGRIVPRNASADPLRVEPDSEVRAADASGQWKGERRLDRMWLLILENYLKRGMTDATGDVPHNAEPLQWLCLPGDERELRAVSLSCLFPDV
jgi:hypothetical protein